MGLTLGVDKSVEPPPGFIGLGSLINTCYMNTAFQALGQTPNVRSDLLANVELLPRDSVAFECAQLLQVAAKKSGSSVMPLLFRWACNNDPELQDFTFLRQHDAFEFFIKLCKSLHRTLVNTPGYQYPDDIFLESKFLLQPTEQSLFIKQVLSTESNNYR
jgi:ubiquitin C-terminal hydrolase